MTAGWALSAAGCPKPDVGPAEVGGADLGGACTWLLSLSFLSSSSSLLLLPAVSSTRLRNGESVEALDAPAREMRPPGFFERLPLREELEAEARSIGAGDERAGLLRRDPKRGRGFGA